MNLRWVIAALMAVCAFGGFADSLYVAIDDPNASDEACEGRGTEALPYWSISAAVKAAEKDGSGYDFAAGDKILVKPGVYTNDTRQYVDSTLLYAQVILTKPVRIESTAGKEKTVHEGLLSTAYRKGTSTVGWGTGSSRCMMVKATAAGSILKGFTFRNGGTASDNSSNFGRGAGIYSLGHAYIVDSTISNCWSSTAGAAIEGGTAIRCYFEGCKANNWDFGTIYNANLWNCIVRETQYSSSGYRTMKGNTCVNCTFLSHCYLRPANCTFQNCLVGPAQVYSADSCTFTNSLAGSTDSAVDATLMSPFMGDCRVIAGTAAASTGDVSKIRALFTVPDEFAKTDFAGNEIDYSAEWCELGAIQGTHTPICGCFRDTGRALLADGWYIPIKSHFRPKTYPSQLRITQASGNLALLGSYAPLLYDNACHLLAPPNPASTNGWWTNGSIGAYWVDGVNGSDETGDGTEAKPYKTIQIVSDKITSKYSVIYVKPGTYATGGTMYEGVLTRFYANTSGGTIARFVSTDGPSKTILVGATDASGECRVCANNGNSGTVVFQGFTIRGGRTTGDHAGAAAYRANLCDCIVEDCTSETSIFINSSLQRCRIRNNTSGGPMIAGAYSMSFCHLTCNNVYMVLTTPGNPNVLSCTFSGNTTPAGVRHVNTDMLYLSNSIMDANGCEFKVYGSGLMGENYLWNFTRYTGSWASSANYIEEDPRLAGPSTGDDRLLADSPALASGAFSWLTHSKTLDYINTQGDIDGRLLKLGSDLSMPMGCNHYDVAAYVETVADAGGLALTGVEAGLTALADGESRTFTVAKGENSLRTVIGFSVTTPDGVSTNHYFETEPTWTCTVSAPETSVKVTALYDINWYVDANFGRDSNDGLTAATAKRTLAGLFNSAPVLSGDVVHLAAGIYNEGQMMGPDQSLTYSRAVVPAGVTLIGTDGKDVTVIEGADSTDSSAQASDGCGKSATRCLYLNKGCRIEGLTLSHGRGYHEWGSGAGTVPRDYTGGGVCVPPAAAGTVVVVDCIFDDCRAGTGAGAYGAVCIGCDFLSCGRSGAQAAHSCTLVSCLIDETNNGNCLGENCTVRNSLLRPTKGYMAVQFATCKLYNSITYGACQPNAVYCGCLLATNSLWTFWSNKFSDYPYVTNTALTTVASLALDSELKPTASSTLLIDRGYNEYLPTLDDDTRWDLAGVPRVMNYRPDVGPYEQDIRPAMKEGLGERVGTIGWVSSNAVVNAAGEVLLDGNGATVEFELPSRSGGGSTMLSLPVTFYGAGTLAAWVNGTLRATTDVSGKFSVKNVPHGSSVVFVFTGSGTATLGRIASLNGLIMVIHR